MHVTIKLSLNLNRSIEQQLCSYEKEMKAEIKRIIEIFNKNNKVYVYPFKEISNKIYWHCKGIVLEQAKIGYSKMKSKKKLSFNFSSIWSNYSYEINSDAIVIELGRNENSKKVVLPFYYHEQQIRRLMQGMYKDMTIVRYHHHWYAYITLEICNIQIMKSNKKMGIDVGVKNPAVAYTQDDKVKFFGNGRERAYVQRRYRKHIQKMQEYKQIDELRKYEHKLHRKLAYYDHKTSKEIIAFAQQNNIGIIVLEGLTNMNKSFNIEIATDIYLWSYRRIQLNIAYKAKLAGIRIKYVNPYNTSKICPSCGKVNIPKDRLYTCSCGFHSHRDIVGAHNIMLAL